MLRGQSRDAANFGNAAACPAAPSTTRLRVAGTPCCDDAEEPQGGLQRGGVFFGSASPLSFG
jgi:hypothetical protein